MLGSVYDWYLRQVRDQIARLSGKITPSREAEIRQETEAALIKAGGTSADVQRAQDEITTALEPYGGSALPQYGGSPLPSVLSVFGDIGLPYTLLLVGAGVLVLIVFLKK